MHPQLALLLCILAHGHALLVERNAMLQERAELLEKRSRMDEKIQELLQQRIKQLEAENAKLKEQLERWNAAKSSMNTTPSLPPTTGANSS